MDLPGLPNSLTFDCNDKGEQVVNIYAIDTADNVKLCPTTLNILDEFVTCGERVIAGQIKTNDGLPMAGVQIFIDDVGEVGGVVPAPVTTDENGNYEILLPVGRDFRIRPFKDDNPSEGVTSFDNVIISRHILNIEPFVSPYQTIAADVNKSGTVTAFDIVLIRKIVLAKDIEFQGNTSWRFVDANYVFESIAGAANESFPESYVVSGVDGNIRDMNFVSIKVGDPNNSANPGFTAANPRNDNKQIAFELEDIIVEAGKVYDIPFRLLKAEKVQSYQFTLDFNGLELLDFKEGILTKEHVGLKHINRGLMTASWSISKATKMADAPWFSLRFKAKKDGNLSEILTLNSDLTPMEAYDDEFESTDLALRFVKETTAELELYQNRPNPFKKETLIGFNLPKAGPIQLTILDINGKEIKQMQAAFERGYHEIHLDIENLPRGILYYRLQTENGMRIKKMMHLH
jgi:hypothetical protein